VKATKNTTGQEDQEGQDRDLLDVDQGTVNRGQARQVDPQFLAKKPSDPFGSIGNLSPGDRIKRGRTGRITEDDPRWNPKTMGNRRGR
jgi:hypothetical protein